MSINSQDVSKISLHDYDGTSDFVGKDMHDCIYDALKACRQLSLKLGSLSYTIDGLEAKKDIVNKIVDNLIDIHADLANQIKANVSNNNSCDNDGHIVIEWKYGDDTRKVYTTLGEIKKDGIILD